MTWPGLHTNREVETCVSVLASGVCTMSRCSEIVIANPFSLSCLWIPVNGEGKTALRRYIGEWDNVSIGSGANGLFVFGQRFDSVSPGFSSYGAGKFFFGERLSEEFAVADRNPNRSHHAEVPSDVSLRGLGSAGWPGTAELGRRQAGRSMGGLQSPQHVLASPFRMAAAATTIPLRTNARAVDSRRGKFRAFGGTRPRHRDTRGPHC